MSSAELAALGIALLVPLMIVARELIRYRRGMHLDGNERFVVLGAAAWGVAGVVVFLASSSPVAIASAALVLMGLFILRQGTRAELLARIAAAGALFVGLVGLASAVFAGDIRVP